MKGHKLLFLIYLLLFLTSSIHTLEQKDIITNVKDLINLVNTKEFEEFSSQYEEDEDINLELSLFEGDECLVTKKDAKENLKSKYNTINNSPNENLRFILGKCNPVLLIPGIYASKLLVEVNCKGLAENERLTTLKEVRIYCGDTICKDESVESEEHPLFVSLIDKTFTILGSEGDKYSSCLGYFMNYFQNENECPTLNNKKLCYNSPYIKVGFYGGTTETESKGKCGSEGVQNVIQSGSITIDNIVNRSSKKL